MQFDDSNRRNEEIQEQQAVTERRANLLQVIGRPIALVRFQEGSKGRCVSHNAFDVTST